MTAHRKPVGNRRDRPPLNDRPQQILADLEGLERMQALQWSLMRNLIREFRQEIDALVTAKRQLR